ncbi:hypothetical protein [Breoghania sp.]|uniref:hypothetical protein n=1 Tax=Breoghania sp. TaxID=2065378 RepID=UPI00261F1789|nr:hypothetical protein [Breoghania sp.]MDJ0932673.1 hypothetical protein [Breoghania sp.]
MDDIIIRRAKREDVEKLHWALTRLSEDIDDDHAASSADLLRNGFCRVPGLLRPSGRGSEWR